MINPPKSQPVIAPLESEIELPGREVPAHPRRPYSAPVFRSLGRLATMTRGSTPPPHRPPGH
jgi:hypothetical protein